MLNGLIAALGTTAGKVGAGVALTAAAAGGAQATDIVDIPLLPDPVAVEAELPEAVDEPEVADGEERDSVEDSAMEEDDPKSEEPTASETTEEDGPEAERKGHGEANHGEDVSELARTTDSEGCEKGQEISGLASSKATDRKNPERDHKPCRDDDDDPEAEELEDGDEDDELEDEELEDELEDENEREDEDDLETAGDGDVETGKPFRTRGRGNAPVKGDAGTAASPGDADASVESR